MSDSIKRLNDAIADTHMRLSQLYELRAAIKLGQTMGTEIMQEILVNPVNFPDLKGAYSKAVSDGLDTVDFEGNTIPVDIAKEMIEKIEKDLTAQVQDGQA